jgi:F-type H+-transporting ATPase subunit c
MNQTIRVLGTSAALLAVSTPAFAQDGSGDAALGKGLAMGLAVVGASIGQGMAAKGAFEAISRNPGAVDKMPNLLVALAFPESLVLFALAAVFTAM